MILGLSQGDPRVVFAQLFDRSAPGLYRYLARRVGSSVAEDLVSETFAVALRERARYDSTRGSPSTWLYGIATNLLRRHHRQESMDLQASGRLTVVADRGGELDQDLVTTKVDAQRRVDQLASRLAELNEADRDVLLLTAWGQLTASEVGEALGIPASTVRTRLHRVRTRLKAAEADRLPIAGQSLSPIPLTVRNPT